MHASCAYFKRPEDLKTCQEGPEGDNMATRIAVNVAWLEQHVSMIIVGIVVGTSIVFLVQAGGNHDLYS